MFNVLFVCTENTCRSPMAQYIFNHLTKNMGIKGAKATSAGLVARENGKMAENAKKALKEIDVKTHFKPKTVTLDMLNKADIVICMTIKHKVELALKFNYLEKLTTFGELVGGEDVADPYGGSLSVYENTANIIYKNCVLLIRKLIKEGKIHV